MKVLNNIKIDFNSEFDRVYELTIACNNDHEVDVVFDKLSDSFIVDCFEDDEVTVIAEAWKWNTKQDFIKKVRKLLK